MNFSMNSLMKHRYSGEDSNDFFNEDSNDFFNGDSNEFFNEGSMEIPMTIPMKNSLESFNEQSYETPI
jgi:hypothetical protein